MTPEQIAEAQALVDELFDSDAASALTNRSARSISALIDALKAQTARADAAEMREAGLLATNETERQTLIRHNAAHAAQVVDLTRLLLKCRPIVSDLARSWAAEAVLLGQIDAAIKSGGA